MTTPVSEPAAQKSAVSADFFSTNNSRKMNSTIRISYDLHASMYSYKDMHIADVLDELTTKTNMYENTPDDEADPSKPNRIIAPMRPYGDIDCYCASEEETAQMDAIIEKVLHELFASTEKPTKYCLMKGSGYVASKGKWKSSWRFVITNLYATKAMVEELVVNIIGNRFKEMLIEAGVSPDREDFDKIVDKQPYSKGRKMRMCNSSKPNENRPLRLVHGELIDTLISYIPEDAEELIDGRPEAEKSKSAASKPRKMVIREKELKKGEEMCEAKWNVVTQVSELVDVKHLDDREDRLKFFWALWGEEQTDRMLAFICKLFQKSSKWATRGEAYVKEKIAQTDNTRISFGTIVFWAKETDEAKVKSIIRSNPIEYCDELFQQNIIPAATQMYDSRYVKQLPISKYDTIILQSHLGTGKTVVIMGDRNLGVTGILQDFERVLFISGRRSFTTYAMGELAKKGIDFESYENNSKQLSTINKLFIQVESLHRLADGFRAYDLVVVDESETICNQFNSLTTHRENMIQNHIMFERLLTGARKVVAADAFVSNRTLAMINHLRNPEHTIFITNIHQPYDRVAIELASVEKDKRVPNISAFIDRITTAIKEKKKIVIVWSSKTKGMQFAEQYLKTNPELKWRFYHGTSTKAEREELRDVATNWRDLDVLSYTSSITVGISYDLKEKQLTLQETIENNVKSVMFDEIFFYGCAASACPRDIAQSLLRCRNIKANKLTYTIDERGHIPSIRGIDELTAAFKDKKEKLKLDHPLVAWQSAPVWAEENYIYNTNEVAVSRAEYRKVFRRYLNLCGYKLEIVDEKGSMTLDNIAETDFDDIREIDDVEADDIEKKKQRDEAEPEDLLALKKYKVMMHIKQSHAEKYGRLIWKTYITEKSAEQHYWNAVREAKTTVEDNAMNEATARYIVMASKSVEQRTMIHKIMKVLKMKHSFETKDLPAAEMDEIIKELAPMENDIRRIFSLAKSRRKGDMDVGACADMISSMFAAWNGSNVKSNAKRVRKEGKQTRVYDYKIQAHHINLEDEEDATTLWDCLVVRQTEEPVIQSTDE